MKKWLLAILLIIAIAIEAWYFRKAPPPPLPTPGARSSLPSKASAGSNAIALSSQHTDAPPTAAVSSTNIGIPSSGSDVSNISTIAQPSGSSQSPEMVLQNVHLAIRNYGKMFGGNPVGNNPEITKALNGGNPRNLKFISSAEGVTIDANGEMLDPWGTPFFFHQLSGTDTEIRSAGPDKTMFNDDDLVVH